MKTSEMAKALGSRGGRARAKRLSPDERRRIASLGGQARRRSFEVARNIIDNLRYAAMVLDLQGGQPPIRRMTQFKGPLPGLYLPKR